MVTPFVVSVTCVIESGVSGNVELNVVSITVGL